MIFAQSWAKWANLPPTGMFGRGRGSGVWTSVFLAGGGSSMGRATTSTPGVRSPRTLTFLWGSRYRESEVLLRCILSLRLLLTRLRLGLSGRRRRNRFTLNGYGGISYKELLVLVSVLLTDRCHLSIEQELRGERGKSELSLRLVG